MEEATPAGEYTMHPVIQQQGPSSPLKATVTLDEKVLDMEVDTGAFFH